MLPTRAIYVIKIVPFQFLHPGHNGCGCNDAMHATSIEDIVVVVVVVVVAVVDCQ